MKKKTKDVKVSVADQLNNELTRLIKIRHSEALGIVNASITVLFWDIGKILNEHLNNEKDVNVINYTITTLSLHLTANFGSFFNVVDIAKMRQFAKSCSKTTLNQIASYVSWKYIPSLLVLETSDELLFYARIIVQQGITPLELNKKISEKLFEQSKPFKLKFPDFPFMDIFSYTNEKQEFLDNFFKNPILQAFRPLFEPLKNNRKLKKSGATSQVEKNMFSEISSKIIKFQTDRNRHLNTRFNVFFWEIGHRIRERIAEFNIPIYEREVLIEKLRTDLEKHYGEIFNGRQILQCVTFAEQFTDQSLLVAFAAMVRWEHILILLPIPEMEAKLFYARLVATKGLSSAALKKQIKNKTYEQTGGAKEREQNAIAVMQNPVIKTTIKKEGNNTFKGTERFINYGDDIDNSLAVNNIFSNHYFLEFITST